ncbi:hypothetical protein WKV44_03990 [Spirochaetia bacterium 38H-sp]|uniref:Uncharacterized protein n=1 Tax=Rarispira pelagica TaxID=3141764 RepID=A0ABU9UB21_9SPIR
MQNWVTNVLSVSGFSSDDEVFYFLKRTVIGSDKGKKGDDFSFEPLIEFPELTDGSKHKKGYLDVQYLNLNLICKDDTIRLVYRFLTSWNFFSLNWQIIVEDFAHLQFLHLALDSNEDKTTLCGYKEGRLLFEKVLERGIAEMYLADIERLPDSQYVAPLNYLQLSTLKKEQFMTMLQYMRAGVDANTARKLING